MTPLSHLPRRALLALFVASLAAMAIAAPALAFTKPQMYKVSFRGDQTTSWNYTGAPAMGGGGCGDGRKIEFRPPTSGKGTHRVTFKLKKPVKAMASPVGKDAFFYARFQTTATSTLQGQYVERWSQIQDCQGRPVDEDRVAETSGCGDFTWKMTVDLKYNLNTQKGRFYARGQGIPLYNPGSFLERFNIKCPFFKYPSGNFFQLEDDNGESWDSHGQGILYSYASVKGKKLLRPRGKTVTIARTASRTYDEKDEQDRLSGSTQVHWVASLKPVRR